MSKETLVSVLQTCATLPQDRLDLVNKIALAFANGNSDGNALYMRVQALVKESEPALETSASIKEQTLDTLINIDRSVEPTYPRWFKKVSHPTLQMTGPPTYNLAHMEQWVHPEQKGKGIHGRHIYEHLQATSMLEGCVGLRDLQAIQEKGLGVFNLLFQGKTIFGWKTVLQGQDGRYGLPYLMEREGKVSLHWYSLETEWLENDVALRFTS